MPPLPRRALRSLWGRVWTLLPASALPLRLRLGGLARRILRRLPQLAREELREPTDSAAYRAWLARRPAGPMAATSPVGPLVTLLMPADGVPVEALAAAIESLRRQRHPRWELCLLASAASPALAAMAAADPRIHLVPPGPAAGLGTGPLLAVIDAADRLAEHALEAVAAEWAAHPDAVLVYTDEDRLDAGGLRRDPWFKPDFDPVLLEQQDVVGRLGVFRREAAAEAGPADEGLARRVALACGPGHIRHIPEVLLHRRDAGFGPDWQPLSAAPPAPAPLVSVIIPTRDGAAMLEACAEGLLRRTAYPALELLILDNGSTAPETFALFDRLRQDGRVRILAAPGPFNYSALNNRAAAEARGEVLLLLNNDIEVIGPGWLGEMVGLLRRPGIGAVGAKLLYPDGTLQHGGVVIGQGGVAGHYLPGAAPGAAGHAGSLRLVREVSAATGACLALRREAFVAVGGLDAAALAVAFNDIDLCLRLREAGWRILWTPLAELYHHESASRGDDVTGAKARRFAAEITHMQRRWGAALQRDPFASPNLDWSHPVPVLADPPPPGLSPKRPARPAPT